MRTLIGTSGYSYSAWKGSFYPEKMPAKKMLGFYATKLATVEINNTFYKLPEPATVQSWADDVPGDFTFAVKAPQQITHRLRLQGAGAAVQSLMAAIAGLGDKQGPILYQLPPFLRKDVPLLSAFLAELPRGGRAAFEFRHESWFSDDVYEALRKGKAALCIADAEKLTTPVEATARWGYLRLRREDYVKRDIAAWAKRIAAQKWDRAYVYFKHEDAGKGPKFAAILKGLM
jgi:uncharacterized protein YecE (DUF72 family)